MTWEIVTGIIALIGVFGSVAAWSSKVAKILATLETTIKALKETIENLQHDNKESHKDIYNKLDDHETRIVVLEHKN